MPKTCSGVKNPIWIGHMWGGLEMGLRAEQRNSVLCVRMYFLNWVRVYRYSLQHSQFLVPDIFCQLKYTTYRDTFGTLYEKKINTKKSLDPYLTVNFVKLSILQIISITEIILDGRKR